MERAVKLLVKLAFVGVAGLAFAYATALSTPYWFKPKQEAQVDIKDAELVRKGEYLAHAGDCIACHTAPGGKHFAGGLGMQTPMGTIYSTNITPDSTTGIGGYSYGDFERAVRKGIRPDGTHLYPAMPYVSYAVVRDDDIKALYAYFMSSVEAVRQDNQPTTMPWPLSMRWPLAWWQLAFAQPREFATVTKDPQLERGAYLVEGLAHCGACHTPRGIAFQETAMADGNNSRFLSGSVLEGWYAKNLRGEDTGLSTWTTAEIVDFLKTGRNDKTAAFGSMADVVEHSSQHLSNDDLTAIATYLKSLKPREGRSPTWHPKDDFTTAALKAGDFSAPGASSYAEHCAICHRMDGKGASRIYPALAGNSMVFADDPSSLIQVTLAGGRMPKTPHDTMAFTMPGFANLTNREVADVLNFIRNGWGNHGSEITEADISRMRHEIARKPKHYVPGEQK
ncbi:MAG: alcohol dehydrogenase [Stutzerimonas stutzeri]|nr:MAG: alcohol dehydrogenase [Stutzerimonas stutzeri]